MNMIEWAFLITGTLLIIIIIILLLNGRGAFLLGWWYLALSKSDKEKYDTVALCKFNGKIILISVILILLSVVITRMYDNSWLGQLILVVGLVLLIFATFYSRRSRRFRKNI